MAGILRAQNVRAKRHIPFHQALPILILFALLGISKTQTSEHYEAILIDTSGSISKGATTKELFQQYLISTRTLLSSEPANTHVWVSSITTDSFGGAREIPKGWTPDARGVFTDNLEKARRELSSNFAQKSSGMSPVAAGTDIFGGLWHIKALFEPNPIRGSSVETSKTIWIFSDMVNETQALPFPSLFVGTEGKSRGSTWQTRFAVSMTARFNRSLDSVACIIVMPWQPRRAIFHTLANCGMA
jgi:hypothetical protein